MQTQGQGQGSQHSQPNSSASAAPTTQQLYPDMFQPPATQKPAQKQPDHAGFDPEFLESVENLKSQNQELSQGLRQTRQGFEALQKDVTGAKDFQRRILEAVNPELAGRQQVDTVEQELGDIDNRIAFLLQKASTPEGQQIKMTISNAVENLEIRREMLQMKRDYEKTVKGLKEQVDYLADPEIGTRRQAYGQIENMMLKGLESLYGEGHSIIDHQLKTMRELAAGALKEARQTPQGQRMIERLLRDVQTQAKFVNNILKQTLPPNVVSRIQEERIMSEPLTLNQVQRAMHEARQIEDPDLRAQVMQPLRWRWYELRNDPKQRHLAAAR